LKVTGTANPQLKLAYDGSNYCTFQTLSDGDMAFTRNGSEIFRVADNTNFKGLLFGATAFTSAEQQVYFAVSGGFPCKITQEALTDGATSHTGFQADAPGSSMEAGATATSWTPSAGIQARTAFIRGHTCDLAIISDGTNQNINFITGAVGSQTQRAQLKSNGDWLFEPRGSAGANSPAEIQITNATSGTASYMALKIDSSGSSCYLVPVSTGYTTSGILIAGQVTLNASGTALNLAATGSSSKIRFWNGSTPTENMMLDSAGSLQLVSTGSFAFSSGAVGSSSDVLMVRDAANAIGHRNGTNAQMERVYNTWTSSTNWEALTLDWQTSSNVALFGTDKGSGGGTARALRILHGGTAYLGLTADAFQLKSTTTLEWSSGTVGSSTDLAIARDAANILGQRNGTNAQELNIYNTWTSSTNFESLRLSWKESSNVAFFGTVKGSGGGTARALRFMTNESDRGGISASAADWDFGRHVTIGGNIDHDGSNIGFFATAPAAKQTVTGSRAGNAALASLLTALATYGIITDSSSA
jgi:hypothetical protein